MTLIRITRVPLGCALGFMIGGHATGQEGFFWTGAAIAVTAFVAFVIISVKQEVEL